MIDHDEKEGGSFYLIGYIDTLASIVLVFICVLLALVLSFMKAEYAGRIIVEKAVEQTHRIATLAKEQDAAAELAASRLREIERLQTSVNSLDIALQHQKRIVPAPEAMPSLRAELDHYKDLTKSLQAELEQTRGKHLIIPNELEGRIFFETGKAEIRKEFEPVLHSFYVAIVGLLQDKGYNAIQVTGHTDEQAIRTNQYADNWDLGAARAVAVVRYLQAQGIAPGLLSAATYSAFNPVAVGHGPADWAQNRRIEVVVFKK